MIILNKREKNILVVLLKNRLMRSSDIYNELKKEEEISLVTIKRTLSKMVNKNIITVNGLGRSTSYSINSLGRIFSEIDTSKYISIEPDKRYGSDKYNFDLFPSFPQEIFSNNELEKMNNLTLDYNKKRKDISPIIRKKELERLIVEFSWKSSKIEGNTYSLLDTEKLLLEKKEAKGKTKEETQMIINHKDAFQFVYNNKKLFKKITRKNLEEVHRLLSKDIGIKSGLRKNLVGISGSLYRPLDNVYQIEEALNELIKTINRLESPYAKAVVLLLGISYIQPFEDGNKRTSRIISDALLMAENCAPLSYRSVDKEEYKKTMIVFYELNTINPFKKLFIEQYIFAAKNYATI